MITDPIADMLTRIRNASLAGLSVVLMPSSKLKTKIAELLLKEGYIRSYEIRQVPDKAYAHLRIVLKYSDTGKAVIRHIRRVSKPGLRVYRPVDRLPKVLGGAGIAILSTSKGLLSDRLARKEQVGGEVLCYVY
ncbi:MAG: 30S ribosomal protein S8 [Candidatus Melainabacteria bacterium]|nr:30S ribosomal protein S8 [Candidatus Melainabacteria bacterium]